MPTVRVCSNCRHRLPDRASQCPNCGALIVAHPESPWSGTRVSCCLPVLAVPVAVVCLLKLRGR